MSKDKSRTGSGSEGDLSPTDFDFRHSLHDTIVLLGGKKKIAKLLDHSQDGQVKGSDVKEVKRYNGKLIDQTKERLSSVHTVKVRPKPESGSD